MTQEVMQTTDRAVSLINASTQYPEFVDRWAIVVGISRYQHQAMNLRFAHRDAEKLCELIQTPSGGAFAQDHIIKLIDEEATTANITRALRSFLKKPASEDIVLIYFACHGAPDPDRPDIVYLLTHDTVPTDISGTALPMREIDLCLRENLQAERVILIADTCHSAAIGGKIGRRSAVDDSAEVLRYLREVGNTKPGLALLTSARANETSQEGEQWNGGHGVFTHYLLEGMRGAAAQDGVVRIGELFDYVCDQVEQATDNRQHPSVGTNSFDQ
ncbi:MAG: caspase family protein, partial [Caldilineaceae bacterium]|nr:caspase family protein [Caldilineaceae bacterium]